MRNKINSFVSKHPNITILVISFILGFITAMFANQSSSFIYNIYPSSQYINDQNMFYYMGQMLVAGKTPYIDFYDHKGPYIFYYTALGVVFGGRIGMVIIQTLLYTVFYNFFIKTLSLYEIKKSGIAVFSIVFAVVMVISGQSPSDFELNFPFMMMAIYYFIKGIKTDSDRYFYIGNFINGIVAGISIHLRATDAMVSLAMVIYFAVRQIIRKKYKNLGLNGLICIGGIFIASIVPLAHSFAGGYTAIMYEACIINNLKYASSMSSNNDSLFKLILSLIIVGIVLIVGVTLFFMKKKNIMPLDEFLFYTVTFAVTFIIQLIIALYLHYLIILLPLGLVFYARVMAPLFKFKYAKFSVPVFLLLLIAGCVTFPVVNYSLYIPQDKVINEFIQTTISKEDRNGKTLCYQTSAAYYLNNDINISYPDFAVQANHMPISSRYTLTSLKNYVSSDQCKYIILVNNYDGDVFVDWLVNESGLNKVVSSLEGSKYISIYSK